MGEVGRMFFHHAYAALLLPYPIGIVKQIRFGLICVSSCQVPIRLDWIYWDRIRNTNIAALEDGAVTL